QHLPRGAPELARTLRAARREAMLFGAVLVVRNLDALAGDEARGVADLTPHAADVLAGHGGPVVATATRNVWPASQWRPAVVVELGVPSETDRIELWTRQLGGRDLAVEAAGRYRITGGTIERAAAAARELAATRGGSVELADLRAGVRDQLDAELATLGRRVSWRQQWADLVVPDDVREELDELVSRVRHRRRVLDEWGFSRKVAKGVGVSALFAGPPGTGKTMVAGLIAMELGLDLYQIDVSRMVSKWIGETEKNLGRLFDAAAAGHVVLLFDEADSLFAKRTEVRSSNDRYANLEVNYLLQRMEEFEGITILTTNLEATVDEAFKRRLAFRIKFPVPEVDERMQLWRAMLPAEAAVAFDIDFRALAERFEMTGGYIRNAVLRAAYLAAGEGVSIRMHHLARAAAQEYQAMGKIIHHAI
ncbi:MAG: ATP-binding protein, partial [Deltaproteobacteria bacterium]|nr:ATP-binding protein [Deltaproteobacteria bacterium]